MQYPFRFGLRILVLAGSLLPLHAVNAWAVNTASHPEGGNKPFRDVVRQPPPTEEGCWVVDSPGSKWRRVACTHAITGRQAYKGAEYYTVGAGVDYSALTEKLTQNATGTFPVVTGVKFATNDGKEGEDKYSLQLNTNISDVTNDGFVRLGNHSPYCSHHNYQACSTWQQFVYLNGVIFIQNWLFIGNQDACPVGWNDQGTGSEFRSCYKNSDGMSVPRVPVAQLAKISLKGIVANGFDTVMFADNNGMISATSQKDSTLEIGTTWKQSEFNVFSSNSKTTRFNPGVSMTIKLAVDDGGTNAPTCIGPTKGGTTAESTNLNLGKCRVFSGSPAGIEFTQSN